MLLYYCAKFNTIMSKHISVRIDTPLEKRMDKFVEVNWSQIMRTGIEQYINQREST